MNATKGVFNWDQYEQANKLGSAYTDQERENMAAVYKATLSDITQYQIVKGSVISITNKDVIVGIGYKSDSPIPASEFRDRPELKAGDDVNVYVQEKENAKGQLVLSYKKAKIVEAWEKIHNALEHGKVLEGLVKRRTSGGLIVELFEIVETFLPGSQIDTKPVLDFDIFVGKTIDVMVIKINYSNDNVVVSHKALTEKKIEAQRREIMNKLEKGQILEGYVKNITKFGAFIDLGGVDGLLHKLDMAWSRVNHPEELFTLGQKVRVVVIGFNEDKKRISLGMKQLQEHPWDSLPETMQVGSRIKGTITNIADYGIFIELIPGIEGFVYILDISWSQYLRDINQHYKVGDTIETCILSLDRKNQKISLGIKQLTGDPWENETFLSTYAVGTTHQGIVRNLTHFGGFIELEPGIEGLLHVSRLSATKRVGHPADVLKLGENLEVIVLGINRENRRLSLGLKQENPWEICENIFEIGSVHKGTVLKKMAGRGAVVELAHGIEGQVPHHHLTKANGQEPEVGEELELQVMKFSKSEKKIILSHQVIFNPDVEAKSESKPKSEAKQKPDKPDKGDKVVPTRGFEAFADLKEKLEQHTKKTDKP